MKPHTILRIIGVALVAIAFVKFSFIGYMPHEGAPFAGLAMIGAGAIGLSDLVRSREARQAAVSDVRQDSTNLA